MLNFFPKNFLSRWHENPLERAHQGLGHARGAPSLLVATWPSGRWGPPLDSPFAYIYLSSRNFTKQNPFLKTYLCSAAVAISISGGDQRTCSGTLAEGEDHSGGLYVAMTASRMMCE